MLELCRMRISDDTIERVCQEEGKRAGAWMKSDPTPGHMMEKAAGEMEFSTDGVKINTTDGWAEMRLNVLARRESADAAEPSRWNDRVLPEPSGAVGVVRDCQLREGRSQLDADVQACRRQERHTSERDRRRS